ncbi:nitroreductase family protein [uncultured Ilyobacter sp.]|uniref:nitroreductase family protein n=1 Tax=uncultured Ilyobacter sp. TaxID=544433 RepID=UPI002AA7CAD8|nr:nitroreductase family protein [uncultured Ilyobacter sp.]
MLFELLKKRRSIRKFQEKSVEADKLETILKAGLISPSGKNKKPWEFVVVDDSDKLEKLSKAKPAGGQLVKDAPVAIVVLGEEEKSDTWVEDCSIALTFMQLEAEEQGLKSCWVQIDKRPSEDGRGADVIAREILGIEGDLKVLAILAMGYPEQERPVYTEDDMDFTKVHYNSFGTSYKSK